MREVHSVVMTITGDDPDVSWADELRTCTITGNVEIHEGQRLAYVAAFDENGDGVRVDLDADGWAQLRQLCDAMLLRIARAEREDGGDGDA